MNYGHPSNPPKTALAGLGNVIEGDDFQIPGGNWRVVNMAGPDQRPTADFGGSRQTANFGTTSTLPPRVSYHENA